MAEYIEREAVVEEMKKHKRAGILIVLDAPAADVVKVVRCKDCIHGQRSNIGGNYVCEYDKEHLLSPKHFCSYGERIGQ